MRDSELSYNDRFNAILHITHTLNEQKTIAQETLQTSTFFQKMISRLNESTWRVKFGAVCFLFLPFTFIYQLIPEEITNNQTFQNFYSVSLIPVFVAALVIVLTQLNRFDVKHKHRLVVEESLSQILSHVEQLRDSFKGSDQLQNQTLSDFCRKHCSAEDSAFLTGLFNLTFLDIHEACELFDRTYTSLPTLSQFLLHYD